MGDVLCMTVSSTPARSLSSKPEWYFRACLCVVQGSFGERLVWVRPREVLGVCAVTSSIPSDFYLRRRETAFDGRCTRCGVDYSH